LDLVMRVPFKEQQGMKLALGYPYESELTNRFLDHLKPGDLFVDVGANMGYFSLLASKLVGSEGRVLAFEPCLDNFVWLACNLQLNRADNVLTFSSALSDGSGMSFISIPPFFNNGVASLRDAANGHAKTPVQLQRFDDLSDAIAPREKIRLIKIDTEGHELNVLEGMRKTLQLDQPLAVACELTPEWTSVGSIVDLLSESGFQGEYYHQGAWRPIAENTRFPAQCNAWFVKNA
jgi:FkbM family methyltransferase